MSAKYITRESRQGRIVPRPDYGLQPSRKAAKELAKSLGLPPELVTSVRRRTS